MARKIEEVSFALGDDAVMYRAADGGPIRFAVTGRKSNTTHIYTSVKVRNHILPADSDAEFNVSALLDVSTSVLTYMAQPHRLEFARPKSNRWWEYTPDFEVIVPRSFVRELQKGTPFAYAALKLPKSRAAGDDLVHLVIEVKGVSKHRALGEALLTEEQRDKKQNKAADYDEKLSKAKSIYEKHGLYFYLVDDKRDLQCLNFAHLFSILVDDRAIVDQSLANSAVGHLRDEGGLSTYGRLIDVLGGKPYGREAANYLHIAGLVWIDLSVNPTASTKVAMPPLLGNRRSLVSLPGIKVA